MGGQHSTRAERKCGNATQPSQPCTLRIGRTFDSTAGLQPITTGRCTVSSAQVVVEHVGGSAWHPLFFNVERRRRGQKVAPGVSPGLTARNGKAPAGAAELLSPLPGLMLVCRSYPGLTPGVTFCQPSGPQVYGGERGRSSTACSPEMRPAAVCASGTILRRGSRGAACRARAFRGPRGQGRRRCPHPACWWPALRACPRP
jgi:hypothetical protein